MKLEFKLNPKQDEKMMRGFDSIESMNAEELLVKRKRGSKRYVVAAAILGGVFFIVGLLIGLFSHHSDPEMNPDHMDLESIKLNPGKYIINSVSTSFLEETLREFSSQSRLAGTDGSENLAEMIKSKWQKSGLDEVHLASYQVLLSFPNISSPNKIEMVNRKSGQIVFTSEAFEPPLRPEDNMTSVPPYNAFSPSGISSGEVVYTNYGTVEDLDYLNNSLKINLTEKIFLIRYGKIFRGNKVQNAERYGAVAVILYSDPIDVNQGDATEKPYPESWWMPDTGVQRGTLNIGNGDTDTPGLPATYYAYRETKYRESLPKIPCQPIGYGDAMNLLQNMSGPVAPASWQGGLPLEYRVGPSYDDNTDFEVRVTVNNYLEVRQIHNVIGYILGNEEPDRYVLLGNHHDAWAFGAVDPESGGMALTQLVKIFGQLVKSGYRPRRTLVFCSWDAEEPGLIGSVEWVEDKLHLLRERAVAYLNVDMIAEGHHTIDVATSPLLRDYIYAAAKKVPSPLPGYSNLYHLWQDRPASPWNETEPQISYSLGSGSDHAYFYETAGVSCADLRSMYNTSKYKLSQYPMYHSAYETDFLYLNYQDPGLLFSQAVTRLWGILGNDIANAGVLNMKTTRFASAVSQFAKDLIAKFGQKWKNHDINIEAFLSAVQNLTKAAKDFEKKVSQNINASRQPYRQRMINDKKMGLERVFLDTSGLPGRPLLKNILFAPGKFDSYSNTFFPGIVDAMSELERGLGDWSEVKHQIYMATYHVQAGALSLQDIGL